MSKTYIEKTFVETEVDLHSDQTKKEIWKNEDGLLHRGRGLPAVTTYDVETGNPTGRERWFRGMMHCIDGPAIEVICPKTGTVVQEAWYRFDKPMGDLTRDAETGKVVRSDFDNAENPLSTQQPQELVQE